MESAEASLLLGQNFPTQWEEQSHPNADGPLVPSYILPEDQPNVLIINQEKMLEHLSTKNHGFCPYQIQLSAETKDSVINGIALL